MGIITKTQSMLEDFEKEFKSIYSRKRTKFTNTMQDSVINIMILHDCDFVEIILNEQNDNFLFKYKEHLIVIIIDYDSNLNININTESYLYKNSIRKVTEKIKKGESLCCRFVNNNIVNSNLSKIFKIDIFDEHNYTNKEDLKNKITSYLSKHEGCDLAEHFKQLINCFKDFEKSEYNYVLPCVHTRIIVSYLNFIISILAGSNYFYDLELAEKIYYIIENIDSEMGFNYCKTITYIFLTEEEKNAYKSKRN